MPSTSDTAADATAVATPSADGSRAVDAAIGAVGGWRGEVLATVRHLIREADPEIAEACKWAKPTNPVGVPVWSHAGIVCTGEHYQQTVKLTFARGAALPDPHRLFNAGLDGNVRRAIDLRETDVLDAASFKTLVRAAIDANLRASAAKAKATKGRP